MKHIILCLGLFFGLYTGHAQEATFTQAITGQVIDEQSGNGLQGVTVSLETEGSRLQTTTDAKGNFRLSLVPVGRQHIKASHVGYAPVVISNIEVTSSKEVVLEIKMKERIQKQEDIVVKAARSKTKPINETALVSSRQLSVDEAFRFSGTRNDPSRMAQNFAGVSGTNDGRNDIIIRGNSPAGVLWRMDGIDIPNPNHFSTLGATGGPVSILNINMLRNSDFITSAFPASYGNAVAGVFDLRLKNGNPDRTEFLGQMGFNGFEFGAEGPFSKKSKASYIVNYRYSMVATLQKIGLNVGTGTATPYYQDATFKVNLPTKKAGTFSLFGLGGESHIHFSPESQGEDNLYSSNDGSVRDRNFKSLTGVLGLSHTLFYNPNTSGKFILAASGLRSVYNEDIVRNGTPDKRAFYKNNIQVKYTAGYTLNKKFNSRNQLTAGAYADISTLKLKQDYIKNGDSVLTNLFTTNERATLLRGFANFLHRFSDRVTTNLGVYYQHFTLNSTNSIEPRWNLKYQLASNQSLSVGAGLHSQLQPLEVYFYQSSNSLGQKELSNKNLAFVKSLHGVLGYDYTISRHFRIKAEVYGQSIYDAAVERFPSSFSMINTGADFGFPDKTNLINNGKGYNYGLELTAERFLHKGLYYLFTASVFESKYRGSDAVWRNTAFNSNYVINALGGKEFSINKKTAFGIDSKITLTGGQRYTPFDLTQSADKGYVIYKDQEAYSLQNKAYFRWDLKFSYIRNLKKVTQKWYIDLQNLTNQKNIYLRTLNPKTGAESQINQIGFFPNINYLITF